MLADRLDDPERALEHLLERVLALRVLERHLAGKHVVIHAAQKVDVGARDFPCCCRRYAPGPSNRRCLAGQSVMLCSSPSMVARPKSTSLATPELEIRMFVALRSRWVTP